jgi:DNA-binding transcriptional LysR family regulator
MDWTAFDWNRARTFLVVAEEGTFSAAARALGVAQPTIGRQVAALEKELGVALFDRIGNALDLTPIGLDLLEQARTMNDAAMRMSLTATGRATAIDGTVRVAASEAISAFILPPIIGELRRQHPGIEIEIVASNSASDLRRREADIAARNFRPTEPDLVAKKVKQSCAWPYATPSYLDRIGNPETLAELSERAEIVAFDRSATMPEFLNQRGLSLDPTNFPIRTENHLVQWELAKRGIAICFMMEEVGDAEPAVRRVLPELFPPLSFPTWLTSRRELRTSRRIRVVYDALVAAFADA